MKNKTVKKLIKKQLKTKEALIDAKNGMIKFFNFITLFLCCWFFACLIAGINIKDDTLEIASYVNASAIIIWLLFVFCYNYSLSKKISKSDIALEELVKSWNFGEKKYKSKKTQPLHVKNSCLNPVIQEGDEEYRYRVTALATYITVNHDLDAAINKIILWLDNTPLSLDDLEKIFNSFTANTIIKHSNLIEIYSNKDVDYIIDEIQKEANK